MTNISLQAINLDSNYAFGVSGDAAAIRFVAPTTTTLTTVAFMQSAAATGAPGNTLRYDLATFTGSATVPAAIVNNGSLTGIAPPGSAQWIIGTYSSKPIITAGEVYFIILGDASGAVGDYIPVRVRGGIGSGLGILDICPRLHSTDGFQSGTASAFAMPFYIEMTDGTVIANPYTQGKIDWASNTNKRGWKIANGFTSDVLLTGVVFGVGHTNIAKLQIFDNTQTNPEVDAPSVLDYTLDADEDLIGASAVIQGFAPVTLVKGTGYRIVVTLSGASTVPDYWEIEDSAAIGGLVTSGFFGGDLHGTISDGVNAWVDYTSRCPMGGLIIDDFDESGGGGGGSRNVIIGS
jgi:hypothetical protein